MLMLFVLSCQHLLGPIDVPPSMLRRGGLEERGSTRIGRSSSTARRSLSLLREQIARRVGDWVAPRRLLTDCFSG